MSMSARRVAVLVCLGRDRRHGIGRRVRGGKRDSQSEPEAVVGVETRVSVPEAVVEFDADAEYAVVAGGQSTAVDVERAGLPGVPGLDDQPGFGPAVAVVALIVAAVVARRR